MTSLTVCERTATFKGRVKDYLDALDPQLWSIKARSIWSQSYLIQKGAADLLANRAAAAKPPSRTDDPPGFKTPAERQAPWGTEERLFFEEAFFIGYTFRNILKTTFVNDSDFDDANYDASDPDPKPKIRFDYWQYDCLTTKDDNGRVFVGGVDVDHGTSECFPDTANPGQVKIHISKTVRFTKPELFADELNFAEGILLPLAFDVWLHGLLFPDV